jgi:hypothetical protein
MLKLLSNLECNVTLTFKIKTHNIVLSDAVNHQLHDEQERLAAKVGLGCFEIAMDWLHSLLLEFIEKQVKLVL